ncbi:MAG: hypothetical protein KKE86_15725 [Planctomycetes bacterium]|nr:hypothetical protein [Planctomycetota bacterium]MBU4400766.1 hypothetical protein [Planctomycetota bacterium]MCG2684612.1 hypothetical protein [Planctomycetales bacterium]
MSRAGRRQRKFGQQRKMVGADVRPYPAAASLQTRRRQDVVDPQAESPTADGRPLGVV